MPFSQDHVPLFSLNIKISFYSDSFPLFSCSSPPPPANFLSRINSHRVLGFSLPRKSTLLSYPDLQLFQTNPIPSQALISPSVLQLVRM